MYLYSLECCGIREIDGLSDYLDNPEEAFYSLVSKNTSADTHLFGCGALLFTQAGKVNNYGKNFAKFIKDNDLGVVTEVPGFRNPNTGNVIYAFIWAVKVKEVLKLYAKLSPKYADRYKARNTPDSYDNYDDYDDTPWEDD